MKIHHIGIACKNIEIAIKEFSQFHSIRNKSEVVFDEIQNATVCMIQTDTGLNIEFISGDKVGKLLPKGISYYHVCYEVINLDTSIQELIDKGGLLLSEPKPAILFSDKRVAFLYLSYGLVELLEK